MTTATRTLVETDARGWYIDADNPEGSKVRKGNGDRVITRADYDALIAAGVTPHADEPVQDGNQAAKDKQATTQAANATTRKDAAAAVKPTHVLTSGAKAVGDVVTIQCAWVDPDKRTKKQQKLFETGASALSFDAVTKAGATAADAADAAPCGNERVIKPQDAFQVRFCPDHQAQWRNELRRRGNQRRKAAREAAKTS
jgi:hypothetical protein